MRTFDDSAFPFIGFPRVHTNGRGRLQSARVDKAITLEVCQHFLGRLGRNLLPHGQGTKSESSEIHSANAAMQMCSAHFLE